MLITLVIPDAVADQLSDEATATGLSLNQYAARLLVEYVTAKVPTDALAGAELIEYWSREGIIGSRNDIADPVAFARELRDRNQNRHTPTAP